MEILTVDRLYKHFPVKNPLGGAKAIVKAVDGVSFTIPEDSVTALVGESGCGKSTVARLVLRLLEPTSGSVKFRGQEVFAFDKKALKSFRKSAQIVFQDPFASLNPRRTVFDTVSEPMVIHKLVPKQDLRRATESILAQVGLGPETMNRYPHEFSGGQRQRICIARSLAVSPELIVADEPLSALDVSIQAQILNLLQDLKKKSGISFLFISHDLRVVRYFSDRVGVMYLGRIVEYAGTDDLFSRPLHPYTELLLSSAPRIGPIEQGQVRKADTGDVPSPLHMPPGCPFHPRCPKRFGPCDAIVPVLEDSAGRPVACHLWNPY
ncbi:MAG: dipeptide ABC transporter ATP-binding protein [Thermodesulfovibrionales bacterium]